MNKIFKLFIFKRLNLIALAFSFAITSLSYGGGQEVYLSCVPLSKSKIVAKLQRKGKSKEEIIRALKFNLPRITPESAERIFGIRWKESELDIKYPAVAICYIGPEVGYGLFAMEDIPKDTYIAEYTGRYLDGEQIGKYIAAIHNINLESVGSIDAEYEGNAARFAEHLPHKLVGYEFKSLKESDVAIENTQLFCLPHKYSKRNDGLLEPMLRSTSQIQAFEQIGYEYSHTYGIEGSPWPEEPYVFNKKGEIVAKDEYKVSFRVLFEDSLSEDYICMFYPSKDKLINQHSGDLKNGFTYGEFENDNNIYIYEIQLMLKKAGKTNLNGIFLPCYVLPPETNEKFFIQVLNTIYKYDLTDKERSTLLNMARNSKDPKKTMSQIKAHLTKKTEEKKDSKSTSISASSSSSSSDSTKKETKAAAVTSLSSTSTSSVSSDSTSSTNSASNGNSQPPPADNDNPKSGADNTHKQATGTPSEFSEEKEESIDTPVVIAGAITDPSSLNLSNHDNIFTAYGGLEQQILDIFKGRYSLEDTKSKILELQTLIESESLTTQEREALMSLIQILEQIHFSREQIMKNKINKALGYGNDDINYNSPACEVHDIHKPCTSNRLYPNNKIFEEMIVQDKELFNRDILKIYRPHLSLTGGTASVDVN